MKLRIDSSSMGKWAGFATVVACTMAASGCSKSGSKDKAASGKAAPAASAAPKAPAVGGDMDVKLKYAGTTKSKLGSAYAFVKANGDAKSVEVYLFNASSKAPPCQDLIDNPHDFNKPLPDGTKALVWFRSTAGGEYKAGSKGASGYLFVFYPEKGKSNKDYASGNLPTLKIKSLTDKTLAGSIEDTKGDQHVKADFVAEVCPNKK